MNWDPNQPSPWGKKSGGRSSHPEKDELDALLSKGKQKIHELFPQGGGKGGGKGGSPVAPDFSDPKWIGIGLVAFLFLWLVSGFYKVEAVEQGVVLRFGEYSYTTGPGLRWHLPYPIEAVEKVVVTTINKEEVGFRTQSAGGSFLSRSSSSSVDAQRPVPEESLMLTGDENIIDVFFEVQWKVSDAEDFLFNVRDMYGENTVKAAAESAMREVIGKTLIASALAEGRSAVEVSAKALLQNILNSYEYGIEVVRLQMLKVDPPGKVIDAFRDVQTARADKEREINQAQAYFNDVVPKARGDARRVVLDAEAYKESVVKRAEGEADRFVAVFNEYRKAKDVTKRRIYLETMESILQQTPKVLLDNKASAAGVLPYLPLNTLQNKQAKEVE